MERDDETGLAMHGVRFYAPWLARWCSSDPSGMVDGPNRFRYARNSPVIGRDVTGRKTGFGPNPEVTVAYNTAAADDLIGKLVEVGMLSSDPARQRGELSLLAGDNDYIDLQVGDQAVRFNNLTAGTLLTGRTMSPQVAGGFMLVGAVGEGAVAAGLAGAPEPTSKIGAAILGTHALDTGFTAVRMIGTDNFHNTATHQVAAGIARAGGASESTAGWVGVGADVAIGVGGTAWGGYRLASTGAAAEARFAAQVSKLDEAAFLEDAFVRPLGSRRGGAAKALVESNSRARLNTNLLDRTIRDSPDPVVDYVDDLGQTYDQMGNPRMIEHWGNQRDNFMGQIDRHVGKADYVVIDLTDFPQHIKDEVSAYLGTMSEAHQSQIIRLGF